MFIKMILKGNMIGMTFVMILFSINTLFSNMFGPFFSQQIVNALTKYQDNLPVSFIIKPILISWVVYIIQDIVFRIISIYYARNIEPVLDAKINITYLDRVMKNCYEFLANSATGYTISVLNKLSVPIKFIIKDISTHFIPNVITCIVIIGSLLLLHWSLFIIVILYMVLCLIVFLATYKKIFYLNQRNIEAYSKNVSNITDVIMNFVSVLSFSRKKFELDRIKKTQHIVSQRLETSGMFIQKLNIVMMVIWILCCIIADIDVIWLFINKNVSIGNVVYVFGVVSNSFAAINGIETSLVGLYSNFTLSKRCLAIMNSGKIIENINNIGSIIKIKGQIDIEDLSFGYKSNKIIFEHQNIHIQSGEKIGLVGSSGAGKTTLMNLIIGNLKPTQGKIMIDRNDIAYIDDEILKDCISVVSQDTTLFNRSILDNIRYSKPDATMEEIIEVAKQANAHDFIIKLPLDYYTNVGEKGMLLSGGERQRILIARAMLKNSPILLLDEAMSALDAENEKIVQDAINALMRNKTVIAITHKLNTLERMDKIIVLQHGKIIEQGKHSELIKNKNSFYNYLLETQSKKSQQ